MGEIKFRAWDGNNNHFDYPEIIELNKGIEYEQFIGLSDRYMKMAFHNDIFEDAKGIRYKIDMSLIYKTVFINGDVGYEAEQFLSAVPGLLEGEIIGNIHETPELLDAR